MPAIRTQRALYRRGSPDPLLDPVHATPGSSARRSSRFTSRDASTPESSLTSLESTPPPRSKKKCGTIEIRGQKLEPTEEVLDTLFYWLFERKAIDDRRRRGVPAPWTDDAILLDYKFCNSYRVLDRTSQFVVSDVIEKGSHLSDTELLFRILLFNCFNRIETWKLLEEKFGAKLTWKDFKISAYDKVIAIVIFYTRHGPATEHRVPKILTQAIGKLLDYHANHMRHLQQLEILMVALPPILKDSEYAADVYEQLAAYPGMAAFTTYQLMISLSYSRLLNFSANDFVVPGPGASSGLVKMFGRSITRAKEAVPDIESDVLRWMVTTQRRHFARLAWISQLELDLADLEHAVCEVDKYARKAHPTVKGLGGRSALRHTFYPSPDTLPEIPVLPSAWQHPKRRVMRVRPGPVVVEQKYVASAILRERPAEKGNHEDTIEYLVSWFGYEEQTWEPRYSIMEDAPVLTEKGKKARC
ncbi:hypothetical protein K438DRAFT_1838613 [Mycena galopus ATCC 62051]|nr:hypothetical protein K438DRAFT_1838613 [Mycena galopus ATCC 62051]